MFTIYGDNLYIFVSGNRFTGIITHIAEKADKSFIFDGSKYRKPVDECDLDDIFKVCFGIEFNSGLKGVSTTWHIFNGDGGSDPNNGKILLCANGNIEGWEPVDKHLSEKTVSLTDIGDTCTIEFICFKKDGVEYGRNPLRLQEVITKEEMCVLFEQYASHNI